MTARVSAAIGLALSLALALAPPSRGEDAPPGPVRFGRDVAPILVRKCLGCHGEAKASAGLSMATFALLRRGGAGTGEAILVPGDPDASELIASVRADASPRMPYKLPPLSDAEIRTLEAWVEQGAAFDGASEAETPIASLHDPLAGLPKVAVRAKVSPPAASAAYTPDGARLAVAVGREVRIHDAATAALVATLDDHPGPLTTLRITPDGKTLIALGGRPGMFGAVTLWDLDAASKRREFRGHADTIQGGDLAPDGRTLATASYDRTVILWDIERGAPLRTLRDHTDAVYDAAFSPDGKRLATAGADRTVKVWDVATGAKLATLGDATAELYAVAFSRDGATVLAGGVDRSIRAWDVGGKEASLVRSAFAHDGAILRLLVSPDGKALVSSGEDRAVKRWELPTLRPLSSLGRQSDWPQSIALRRDGSRLAIGRHDGSVAIVEPDTGRDAATLGAPASAQPPAPPALVRGATLNPPSPRGVAIGSTARVTLTGQGVGRATAALLPERGLTATILPAEKPDPNRLELEVSVAPDARVGLHSLSVATPLGVPGFQSIAVEAAPATAESEPNDDPSEATPSPLPATLVGAIDKPGDVDHFRFEAVAGRPVVFRASAKSLGSNLLAVLTVLDGRGSVLAERAVAEGARDPVLTVLPERDGPLTLRVADADFGGSGGHFYRIAAGADPLVTGVFPLGVAAGTSTVVDVQGVNLAAAGARTVDVPPPVEPGTILDVPAGHPAGAGERRKVVVADGPQGVESEPNDDHGQANPVAVPGGISGRVGQGGDVDLFRFEARRGERLIVEVYGRRLGSPIDPVLEILDAQGGPVPRAVLRPVSETEVAFRDHNASGPGVRLTRWNNLAMNDTVLFGREVARVFTLPRNPDDDCQFWSDQGRRLGFLETTPEHHPMGQPIYKVEVHPPGRTFPEGGVPPVTLYFRNDDGGPGFDKDARVTFDPPADGTYLARVADVRGLGGADFAYHLVVRAPRPRYSASVGVADPNIHRGGTLLVPVNVTRIDGFDDPIEVSAVDLPPGITATPAVVERGMSTALLALTADPTAPAFTPPSWRLRARSLAEAGEAAGSVVQEIDPGGPAGGRITVIPGPNLAVTAEPDRVVLRAGGQVNMRLKVDRSPAFRGRVPIDVRNLPYGVRVLNIGLNGVLVTESEAERTITLYAEPWVRPMTRPFYAVGRAESAGTEHSTAPIMLVVEPADAATADVGGR